MLTWHMTTEGMKNVVEFVRAAWDCSVFSVAYYVEGWTTLLQIIIKPEEM